jgi:hypothetical protein
MIGMTKMTIEDLIETGSMSETEMKLLIQENETQHIPSCFQFLNEHKGWRPGKLHLAIAPTGAGKSTLTRSFIWDYLVMTDYGCVALWLSEETSEDFKTEFAKIGLPPEVAKRLVIGSEQDHPHLSLAGKKKMFHEFVTKLNAQIVFFDNLTTSVFYGDKPVEDQASFSKYLKTLAQQEKIPVITIAHTGGATQLTKRLLEENDIRGGKTINTLVQFLYILQMFEVYDPVKKETKKFPTIRLKKYRGYSPKNYLFKLRYNPLTMSFMQDKVVDWEEFKEAFNNQMTI